MYPVAERAKVGSSLNHSMPDNLRQSDVANMNKEGGSSVVAESARAAIDLSTGIDLRFECFGGAKILLRAGCSIGSNESPPFLHHKNVNAIARCY
jgi:hypothetical protein